MVAHSIPERYGGGRYIGGQRKRRGSAVGISLSRTGCTALPARTPLYARPRAGVRAPRQLAEGRSSSLLISCCVAWRSNCAPQVPRTTSSGSAPRPSAQPFPVRAVRYVSHSPTPCATTVLGCCSRLESERDRTDRTVSSTKPVSSGTSVPIVCRIYLDSVVDGPWALKKALPLPRHSPETGPALARRQDQQALRPGTLTSVGVCQLCLGVVTKMRPDVRPRREDNRAARRQAVHRMLLCRRVSVRHPVRYPRCGAKSGKSLPVILGESDPLARERRVPLFSVCANVAFFTWPQAQLRPEQR